MWGILCGRQVRTSSTATPPPLHRRTTLTSAFDGALRGGQGSQTCQKAAEGSGSNDTFTQLMQQSGQFRLFVVLLVLFVLLFVLLVLLLVCLVCLALLLHGHFPLHRRVPLHVWWTTHGPTPVVQKRVRIPWDFIRLRGRGGREKST